MRRTVGVNISGTVRMGRVRGVAGGEKEEEGMGVWTRPVPKGKVGGGEGAKGKFPNAFCSQPSHLSICDSTMTTFRVKGSGFQLCLHTKPLL